MKLRLPLVGLVVAFPLLYVGGALLGSAPLATAGLVLTAVVCVGLLWPKRAA